MKPETPDKEEWALAESTEEERLWGMLAHFSILLQFAGVIGVTFIVPLIMWLLRKDSSPFIEDQAKEAMNFQLAVLIVSAVVVLGCVTSPLVLIINIAAVVYGVIAGMKAHQGIEYRYPYTLRLIK